MTEQEIRAVFDKLADVVCVLSEAAPNDKSEISCQLDLKLTYQPGEKNRGSEDRTCSPWVFRKCPRTVFTKYPTPAQGGVLAGQHR
jgi:hypothetical protein